jgi:Protein of unknown function (DUF2721)
LRGQDGGGSDLVSTTSHLTDVAHVIQVAVAPVFLLSGIGTMLGVFIARLGRIVDRSRVLDDRLEVLTGNLKPRNMAEFMTLSRRSRLIERAIVLATAAGFFVCLVIVTLFVDYLFGFEAAVPVAAFFLLGMLCLIAAFGNFLYEVITATSRLRRETHR